MNSIIEIEEAISSLKKEDIKEFRRWFFEFDAKEWDNEILNHQNIGKLDDFISEALDDYKNGNFKIV